MENRIIHTDIEFLKRGVWIAARDGQADRLIALLWKLESANDVNEILNYHKEEECQSTTPLIIAVCNGHEDVVNVLLIFGVDIDQKGTIKTVDNQIVHDVTALWCAACCSQFIIVKVLVRNGANVNSPTKSGSQPLRAACFVNNFEIVQYLVEHGADINCTNIHQNNCLMLACAKGHYDIIQYLLEMGANTEAIDKCGQTVLHEAAGGGHFLIAKLLVETGVTMTKDNDGLSPLMLAAMNGHPEIADYLSTLPECSIDDRIDSLELLGSSYMFNVPCNFSKTYNYLQKAMKERFEDTNETIPKPVSSNVSMILDKKECKSLNELEEIKDNELALAIEALIIEARILGPNNWQSRNRLMSFANVLRDMGEFNKAIKLLVYASKLKQNNNEVVDTISFPKLFAKMLKNGITTKFSSLLESFKRVVTEKTLDACRINNGEPHYQKYYEIDIRACMYLVGLMLLSKKSKNEDYLFHQTVYNFIQHKPVLQNGFTPLHMCCANVTNDNNIDMENVIVFPNVPICQTLMTCGANVNAQDKHNNTPLHIIAKCKISDIDINKEIIQCLVENGAHIDARNKNDMTAVDVAYTKFIGDLIQAHMTFSLKCLSATVIMRNRIPYEDVIPVSLYGFVKLH